MGGFSRPSQPLQPLILVTGPRLALRDGARVPPVMVVGDLWQRKTAVADLGHIKEPKKLIPLFVFIVLIIAIWSVFTSNFSFSA